MPKTLIQCKQIKDERLETITNCAIYLFATKQYKAITVDDITKAANCSHGLFYHYFSSKEDLFHAVMEKVIDTVSKEFCKDSYINVSPKEALYTMLNDIFNVLKSKNDTAICSLYLLFNLSLQKNDIPKPKNKLNRPIEPFPLVLLKTIENGQNNKTMKQGDAREYMVAILATLKGLTYNRLFVGPNKFICPSTEILMNMVVIQ